MQCWQCPSVRCLPWLHCEQSKEAVPLPMELLRGICVEMREPPLCLLPARLSLESLFTLLLLSSLLALQVISMERSILTALNFDLSLPTTKTFLR